MNSNNSWPFEPGSSGVLAAGRWLWLRATLWALLLSTGALVIFLATQFLTPWLHLPPNSNYPIVLLLPIAAFVLYALSVHEGEQRVATEVLPSFRMLGDLIVGAVFGFCMLSAMLSLTVDAPSLSRGMAPLATRLRRFSCLTAICPACWKS